MFDTAIWYQSGLINKVNDTLAGGGGGNIGPQVGIAPGQLGAGKWLDDSNVFFDSAMGTVYGGHFRYVRLAAAALAVVVGQVVFWDTIANAADNLFQVTTAETGTTDAAVYPAGVVLNSGWSAGNYSIIQDIGPTFLKFRAALTAVGAIGSRAFCAAVGGADLGFADVVDGAGAATIADVSKMAGRFLGVSIDAPTNGGLKRVDLRILNIRG